MSRLRRLKTAIHQPLIRWGLVVACLAALCFGHGWIAVASGVLAWIAWRKPTKRRRSAAGVTRQRTATTSRPPRRRTSSASKRRPARKGTSR
jgi:hypothetical protein